MTVLFESTRKFEKGLKKFSSPEKARVIDKLNQYVQLLDSNEKDFYRHAFQPRKIKLTHDNESTLFALRVTQDIRIILTVDKDPLFDQTLITLLGISRHSDLPKLFNNISESIYQSNLINENMEDL
jgi:mRNA-degrading endonuclease RelE of RelBE toxin-antitoxin system